MNDVFDVIVVGGGHAGIEAAAASARMSAKTLLVTLSPDDLGKMSCNPSIGGIGKSHLVKEVDALGGLMARATDKAGIQFRVLNSRKGLAVQATRAQTDRVLYQEAIRGYLSSLSYLKIIYSGVSDLIVSTDSVCSGVRLLNGSEIKARAVIITAGTFLGGVMHFGLQQSSGGRFGDSASVDLADRLRDIFQIGRLKTGTPPRLDGNTINYDSLEEQWGDALTPFISEQGETIDHPAQKCCWITQTNPTTHDVVHRYCDQSPMFSGVIQGVGPRYCPSIEDKVVRFADKQNHQIFLEPEGLSTDWIYPNGISTSMPKEAQDEIVRSIVGLENVKIVRYGYAIEYDYIDPRSLHYFLESKCMPGLFWAGQVNGTTGYEEAAAQGVLAGINAVLRARDQDPWVPGRDKSYLGVMIDDLVLKGVSEPYRMFTSRAEYRLFLREDNADTRLTEEGHRLGVITEEHWRYFCAKQEFLIREEERLKSSWLSPELLASRSELKSNRDVSLYQLLKRPEVAYADLSVFDDGFPQAKASWQKTIEASVKYSGYIDRQKKDIDKMVFFEEIKIPDEFDFDRVSGLSYEVLQILKKSRPQTLGQVSRLSGVTPASIQLLRVYLKRCCGV